MIGSASSLLPYCGQSRMDGKSGLDWPGQVVQNGHFLQREGFAIDDMEFWPSGGSPTGYYSVSNDTEYRDVPAYTHQQDLSALGPFPMARTTSSATASNTSSNPRATSGRKRKSRTRRRSDSAVQLHDTHSPSVPRNVPNFSHGLPTLGEVSVLEPNAYDSPEIHEFGGSNFSATQYSVHTSVGHSYSRFQGSMAPNHNHNTEFVLTPTSTSTDTCDMSRDSSNTSNQLGDAFLMCRLDSNAHFHSNLNCLPDNLETCFFEPSNNTAVSGQSLSSFLTHPTIVDEPFPSNSPMSYISSSSPSTTSCLQRQELFDSSFPFSTERSHASLYDSRNAFVNHEHVGTNVRPIAPKVCSSEASDIANMSSTPEAKKLQQGIGNKREIPHANRTYRRPVHEKKFCDKCDDYPEGFRGEHELRRHRERQHGALRKTFICVEKDPNGTFLANCKACRGKKRYNAYYNCAAHLRRAHFNKRQRKKQRGEPAEKRGGMGGGDWPPMDELWHWMKQVDEFVPENYPSLSDEYNSSQGSPSSSQHLKCESPELLDHDYPPLIMDNCDFGNQFPCQQFGHDGDFGPNEFYDPAFFRYL